MNYFPKNIQRTGLSQNQFCSEQFCVYTFLKLGFCATKVAKQNILKLFSQYISPFHIFLYKLFTPKSYIRTYTFLLDIWDETGCKVFRVNCGVSLESRVAVGSKLIIPQTIQNRKFCNVPKLPSNQKSLNIIIQLPYCQTKILKSVDSACHLFPIEIDFTDYLISMFRFCLTRHSLQVVP